VATSQVTGGGGGATRPFPRDGGAEELHKAQQSGNAPRSGPDVKNRRSSTKNGTPERLICGTIQEENPAEDVCRRCKKNSPSILSCIGKKIEGCDRGTKVGQFTAGETGKGQFL